MSRHPFFKKFFRSKTSSALTSDSQAHKKPAISSLSKLKAATKARCHTLSAAFYNKKTLIESTVEDVPADEIDLFQYLPAVNGIGTGLQLNFDHQENEGCHQSIVPGSFQNDFTGAEPSPIDEIRNSDLALSQAQSQSYEDVQDARSASAIDAQNSSSIVSVPPASPEQLTQHRASSVGSPHGCTAASIIALPQSPHAKQSAEENPDSDEVTSTLSTSTVVHVHTSSNTSFENSNSGVVSDHDAKTPCLPVEQVSTSPPKAKLNSVDDARDAIYHVSTAVNAQQALLDFADVYASAVAPVTCMKAGQTNVDHDKDISDVATSSHPDAALLKVDSQCLSLADAVPGYASERSQQEPDNKLDPSQSLQNKINQSIQKLPGSNGHLSFSEDIVATLEARVRELEQQNHNLEAETDLLNENKKLISKVNNKKMEELEAEIDRLVLRNYSLDYNNRQTQAVLIEERERARSDLEAKDSHIRLLRVDEQSLRWQVGELSSRFSEMSAAASRQSSASREKMSAKDEELAEIRVKTAEVDSVNAKLQTKVQVLEEKQEEIESALREAQTEAWTKKHLHEEVCRTLELSKQMHKEANESGASLAVELERLEARYKMSRQVSERMLADSWQANAAKEEHIKILTTTAPTTELVQRLDDKQCELDNFESRLIATQRLVETLDNQLKDAQTKHTELEVENKKLECQLGEAKMRLDHDYQDEERLKAELEKARADLEERKESAEEWQRVAVANLDIYARDSVEEVKDAALAILQRKIDDSEVRIKELREYNKKLEIDLDDLGYELSINERRLTMDESFKFDFYQEHWSKIGHIFDENKLKTAIIKGLEARFSKELEKEPLATPEVGPETFEEEVGQEFIDRSNALYRVMYEAREGRGEDDLRRSDLDTERIKAIYGHGPAGYKPRAEKEMPEGYQERNAAREIERLKRQVKDLKGKLWRGEGAVADDHTEEYEAQVGEEVGGEEENWETEEEYGEEGSEFF